MLRLYVHYIVCLVVLQDRISPGDILTGTSKFSFEVYQHLTGERHSSLYTSIICNLNIQIAYVRGVGDKLIALNTSSQDKIMVVFSSTRN
jgi:hypothetical protein